MRERYAAREDGETPVTAAHVRKALDSKIERHNLFETKIREMVQEGVLLIDAAGAKVGQVNGLSVLEIGGYAFGRPVRITASVALVALQLLHQPRQRPGGMPQQGHLQLLQGVLARHHFQNEPFLGAGHFTLA